MYDQFWRERQDAGPSAHNVRAFRLALAGSGARVLRLADKLLPLLLPREARIGEDPECSHAGVPHLIFTSRETHSF